ncbi:MAG TPA: 2-isopropylmalate synthase [Kiritimatiellia bacterium]|nr:2-isopropylmalate synthase [Kiritimatiellia bacterium]HRZ13096.1 2-isopropylmalate synthase [Kiritimatiellia bacterium]HSA17517.1 2-isopropylmalate synthase [Kiritimatiellia bacterium]
MSAAKNSEKNRVIIFDTTLRDGEQCPGASMNIHEKLEVARQLARLNVDVIEAGFPIASPGDFEAVKAVAEQVKGPYIAGLARCINKDIERCAEAVAPAGKKAYIHTFLATSAIHRQFKLKKAKHEIVKQAVASVKHARTFCDRVQFSPEDASRTEPEFLAEVCEAVIDAGATTVNIPDTVGYAVPIEFGRLIAYLVEHVKNIHRAIIHVHCHNDLGLAVANSLAAVRNGARGVECTINGLGERAGNCSLEEVVMGLKVRGDAFGRLWTSVKTRELYRTSRLVSQMSGMVVQRNKAIVGANAFAHEAGIHQDGILKERTTYEIMRPEEVGISGSDMVLGKHSGRHALFVHLGRMGFQVAEDQKESVYNQFKELCDKKKYIYDDDLIAIMRERISDIPQVYTLDYFHVATGTSTVPTATVRLKKGEEVFQDSACGDGPVDATLKTIDRITGTPGTLEDYSLQAVTRGEDAVGEVSVTVAFGKDMVSAKAASTDIVEASAKAYLNALNSHLFAQQTAKGPKKKAAGRRQGRQP